MSLQKQPALSPAERGRLGRRAGVFGGVANLLLFAFKLVLGLGSGSVAVMSDAFNNLVDAVSSLVVYAGFRIAGIGPTKRHPFGHGRMEYVSALLVSIFVVLTGLGMGKASVARFWTGAEVRGDWLILAGVASTIAAKLVMAWHYRRLDAMLDSTSIRAATADSLADAAITGCTLIALLMEPYTRWPVDGAAGLLVAATIAAAGCQTAREAINRLIGPAPDPQLVERLVAAIMATPNIKGVHALIVNDYGPGSQNASAHVEMPREITLDEANRYVAEAMQRARMDLGVDLVLHIDLAA